MAKGGEVKITIPTTELDFRRMSELITENIAKDDNCSVDSLKACSLGQVIIAKVDDRVVGALKQSRPGEAVAEIDEKYFDLDMVSVNKEDIGWIGWIAVDKNFQKRGIGKSLVKKALKYQRDWGSKAVETHCWQNSPGKASEKLFKKMGFSALRIHKAPWEEWSKEVGPDKYFCQACGNPCDCDELAMIKYL